MRDRVGVPVTPSACGGGGGGDPLLIGCATGLGVEVPAHSAQPRGSNSNRLSGRPLHADDVYGKKHRQKLVLCITASLLQISDNKARAGAQGEAHEQEKQWKEKQHTQKSPGSKQGSAHC